MRNPIEISWLDVKIPDSRHLNRLGAKEFNDGLDENRPRSNADVGGIKNADSKVRRARAQQRRDTISESQKIAAQS